MLWLDQHPGSAQLILEEIASHRRGRELSFFGAFRRKLWRSVGDRLELSSQFNVDSQDELRGVGKYVESGGKAAIAPRAGHAVQRRSYELHPLGCQRSL